MKFTEINLFGVYVAPMSVMMVAAWVVTIGLRRFAARFGLLRYVWHPSLFVLAVYLIVLSSIVLLIPGSFPDSAALRVYFPDMAGVFSRFGAKISRFLDAGNSGVSH